MERVNIARPSASLLGQVLRLENLDFLEQFAAFHQSETERLSKPKNKFWHHVLKLWLDVATMLSVAVVAAVMIVFAAFIWYLVGVIVQL